jgi:hypothetical protein
MIIFNDFIEERRGFQFESMIRQSIVLKIIDGYTGLVYPFWKDDYLTITYE